MKVPKQIIHQQIDNIIIKGEHPDAIKDLEEIAKHRKTSIYEVMEQIMIDMKLTTYEDIFKAFNR